MANVLDPVDRPVVPVVFWKDVLNYQHLPMGWSLEAFAKEARKLGYPYFLWNGWIYDTKTNQRLDITSPDIK